MAESTLRHLGFVLVWCLLHVLQGVTSQCENTLAYEPKCQEWVDQGECVSSSKFMAENCPTLCDTSSCKCPDKAVAGFGADTTCDCLAWAAAGLMVATNTDMKTKCPSTFQSVTTINCGTPPSVANADVQFDNTFYLSGVATYNCKTGYGRTSGLDGERWCQKDKTWKRAWHRADPVCAVIICPKPTDVTNAEWKASDSSYKYGTSVTYTCKSGMGVTSGDSVLKCGGDKTWTGTLPKCGEVTCGTPGKIQHAQWSYQAGKKDNYNDTVTYKCNEGFSIVGGSQNENITCQGNGKWTAAPSCTFGTSGDSAKPVLFVGGSDASVVFAAMFPFIFLLAAVVVVESILIHRCRMKEMTRSKQLTKIYMV